MTSLITAPSPAEVAEAMDRDAEFYRALAAETVPNSALYGPRAEQYAAGLSARYLIHAEFCAHEARQMRVKS